MSSATANGERHLFNNDVLNNMLLEKIKPSKMRSFIREFGAFPQENRALVWRCLLQAPLNHTSFRPLVIKAMDSNLPPIWEEWISQRDLLRPNTVLQLNRLLHWLITWSPELKCLEFLPQFTLPFATLMGNDPVTCFESTATAIANWGSFWLEMCPEPPFQLMTLIEELLQKFGPGAFNILKKNSRNIVSYAWPLFETGFECCLTEKSWRQLWDHIVCNKPAFFVSAVVAFICCTEPLMRDLSNDKTLFSREHDIDIKVFLRKSYEIYDSVANWPPILTCDLITLPKGHYISLETLMSKKSDSNYKATKQRVDPPEKPYKADIPSLDLSHGIAAAPNDLAGEIMGALQFSHKVRDAVDSWKGGQLSESSLEMKAEKQRKIKKCH